MTYDKCYMFHSITHDIIKYDFNRAILTFDDALFSQYYYWDLIESFDSKKILFIPTNAIRLIDECRPRFKDTPEKFVDCKKAMADWKNYNFKDNYMTLGELKFLKDNYNVTIGCHSHDHFKIKPYKHSIIEHISYIKKDINLMFEWFDLHLNIKPTYFCYPYNKLDIYLYKILKDEGITKFYGEERIDADDVFKG